METKTFDTIYGTIILKPCFDADTNEEFFAMYTEDEEGYYGELHCNNNVTAKIVEDQIEENLYC